MKEKIKTPAWKIVLLVLDIAITISLFVISIIMLATMPKDKAGLEAATGFIGYLQKNPTVYLYAFVLPLFVLLVLNVIYLILFIRKNTEKKKVELKDLSPEEKAKLKEALIKDLANDNKKENEKK